MASDPAVWADGVVGRGGGSRRAGNWVMRGEKKDVGNTGICITHGETTNLSETDEKSLSTELNYNITCIMTRWWYYSEK